MNILQMFSYPFMQRALIAGVLVSLCAALLGVPLVLKRYSMIGDGLSHVSFGALAIAVALLIPNMGGIVNVVISVAALTGVPLYLPLIWSLFSKNLNLSLIHISEPTRRS